MVLSLGLSSVLRTVFIKTLEGVYELAVAGKSSKFGSDEFMDRFRRYSSRIF